MNKIKNKQKRIIVLGGGPTGLGAAWRLKELGHKNWELYEKENFFGGLASSYKDKAGFVWDNAGGHIYFPQYSYFKNVFRRVMKKNWHIVRRNAWILLFNRLIPYPFQNNIRYLPKFALWECVRGLLSLQKESQKPKNFFEYNLFKMGEGISRYFMVPYNTKAWAWPPKKMSCSWLGDRVSPVDSTKILENIILEKDEKDWGPNGIFQYPLRGGAGDLYRRIGENIGNRAILSKEARCVDLSRKTIFFTDGSGYKYNTLVSSIPLNVLIEKSNVPVAIRAVAKKLRYNSGIVINVGLKGNTPPSIGKKTWIYFPEKKYAFHRIVIHSNYSPYLAGANRWALVFETSFSPFKKIDRRRLRQDVISYLKENSFIRSERDILSFIEKDFRFFYPVPTLDRDENLRKIQSYLNKRGIYSVGRFGAWKYELGNMDHGFMQGVEIVNKIANTHEYERE